jgi:DNA-directed RNA polymerase subunit alpha
VLRIPITDFELSVRSRNCLSKMNIRTLGDLVKKTEAELLSYKNFGETSLNEIKEILKSKNLRLGMDQEDLLDADLESSTAVATPPAEPSAIEGVGGGDVTQRPVADLELSVRSRRIIDLLKVKTIGDLSSKTEAELLACPNFGQTSLNEIKAKLEELGLALKG